MPSRPSAVLADMGRAARPKRQRSLAQLANLRDSGAVAVAAAAVAVAAAAVAVAAAADADAGAGATGAAGAEQVAAAAEPEAAAAPATAEAAAAVPAASAAAQQNGSVPTDHGAAAEAVEEKDEFDVILTEGGAQKIQVIKAVR